MTRWMWVLLLATAGAAIWLLPQQPSEFFDAELDDLHPADLAVGVFRIGAAAWWLRLASLTSTILVAERIGDDRLRRRAADGLPQIARRAMRPIAAGIVVVSLTTPISAAADESTTTAVESGIEDTETEVPFGASGIVPTIALVDDSPPSRDRLIAVPPTDPLPLRATAEVIGAPADDVSAPSVAAPLPDPNSSATTWTVQPGDHLWGIAEATATDDSLETIAAHWLRIIEINRHRLPDPGNPDLILPGLVVELPPTT